MNANSAHSRGGYRRSGGGKADIRCESLPCGKPQELCQERRICIRIILDLRFRKPPKTFSAARQVALCSHYVPFVYTNGFICLECRSWLCFLWFAPGATYRYLRKVPAFQSPVCLSSVPLSVSEILERLGAHRAVMVRLIEAGIKASRLGCRPIIHFMMSEILDLYADGSFDVATRSGGWAFMVMDGHSQIHTSRGAMPGPSNNTFEVCRSFRRHLGLNAKRRQ